MRSDRNEYARFNSALNYQASYSAHRRRAKAKPKQDNGAIGGLVLCALIICATVLIFYPAGV